MPALMSLAESGDETMTDQDTGRRLAAAVRRMEAAARRLDDAVAERDALIAAMRREGATLRAIGQAAGITHAAVSKALRRDEVADAESTRETAT